MANPEDHSSIILTDQAPGKTRQISGFTDTGILKYYISPASNISVKSFTTYANINDSASAVLSRIFLFVDVFYSIYPVVLQERNYLHTH